MNQGKEPNVGEGSKLPPRLKAVGEMVADGKNNQEIADQLTVTLHTAEKYVSELKKNLKARDRVDLVLKYKNWGAGSH